MIDVHGKLLLSGQDAGELKLDPQAALNQVVHPGVQVTAGRQIQHRNATGLQRKHPSVIGEDGRIQGAEVPERFVGLSVDEAQAKIVACRPSLG